MEDCYIGVEWCASKMRHVEMHFMGYKPPSRLQQALIRSPFAALRLIIAWLEWNTMIVPFVVAWLTDSKCLVMLGT